MQEKGHAFIDNLVTLGLLPTEALVYATLLELGPCFVAPIVAQTRKHRQIVYNALDGLARKNLVLFSLRRGKRFYAIGDAQRFISDLEQKETVAKQVVSRVERRLKTAGERVEVFTGPDSFERGLADFRRRAEEAEEYTVIGGEPEEWFEYTKPIFAAHVEDVRRLKKLGIPIFILFFESERKSAIKYIGPFVGDPYVLKVSSVNPKFPHTAWLAGEHVYILTPVAEPLVVHVHSIALAREYRKYFEVLWDRAEFIRRPNVSR